jgi:hypothetical protein
MKTTLTKWLFMSTALAAIATVAPRVGAQDDDDAPPPEVITTLAPVYFEGHAAYWWHNRWHYRDAHGAWGRYQAEPQYLRDHRFQHPAERHYYAGGHERRR